MLRSFQKYKKSIIGATVSLIIALSMLGFGVNMYSGRKQDYAIRIDDTEVSIDEFYRERRSLENRYRMMLGKNFDQLARQMNLNLSQTAADNLISEVLLERAAREYGLAASDAEVTTALHTNLFPQGYSKEAYTRYLSELGMTAPQFESELKTDLLRQQFIALLTDPAIPSSREIAATAARDLTTYTAGYVEFSPSAFIDKVPDPADDVLKRYYEENADEFEVSAKVSYDFLPIDPELFPNLIEVQQEDIELFYADNASRFKRPDEVRVRHVFFDAPSTSTPEQRQQARTRAQRVLERVKKGEELSKLAELYSEDYATKEQGGDLGWFTRGKMKSELEKAAFRLKTGGAPEIVEAPYGIHVINVEGYKPGSTRGLDEVREEIVAELKKRDLPAYLASKAQELYDAWVKAGTDLRNFAASQNLVASPTTGLLQEGTDPDSKVAGLTEQVVQSASSGETKLNVELGERAVLVQVKDFQEPQLAPLGEARQKVVYRYKESEARKLSSQKAKEFLEAFKGANTSIAEFASKQGLKTGEAADLTRTGEPTPPLTAPDLRQAIFSVVTEGEVLGTPFEAGDSHYVVQVKSIKAPSTEVLNSKLPEYRQRATEEQSQAVLGSVLTQLKAQAETDVNAALLAQ